jgi:hypothetical protein
MRAGRIAGRNFSVNVVRARRTLRTRIEVRVPNTSICAIFYSRFFDGYPNWEHAKILGSGRQRLFFAEISIPGYVTPEPEQREAVWRWLDHGPGNRQLPYELVRSARIDCIAVDAESISTDFSGVVTDIGRLSTSLALLQRFGGERASAQANTGQSRSAFASPAKHER